MRLPSITLICPDNLSDIKLVLGEGTDHEVALAVPTFREYRKIHDVLGATDYIEIGKDFTRYGWDTELDVRIRGRRWPGPAMKDTR